ncbi:hypothetical protein KGA66_06090 [Actinocrinis puniceicyclus]|uniref:Uncharacterized protein n=1 Tax=Actinocrinis puniceicyclus TaxID=977794 RepID=A0A8J7WML3_9ACTN|nr:hypothetical protein [Actinocrinis puniceicyclus]MBS2962609.1 hypothetical protein [Actinocrinis puniceicyclus]
MPDHRRTQMTKAIVLAALLATLAAVTWLLLATATPTTDRPSHGSTIASPTAAAPR